jgi:peptide/nickel transport system permease protein
VMDVIWAFPVILLGIALGTSLALGGFELGPISVAGDSLAIPILVIAVVYVPYLARPIRGEVLALREKEFVEAARAQGQGSLRIMFGEILPNVVSTLIVFFPLLVANAILLEAALSFLGAGVQPPDPSWGTMINDGVDRIITAPTLGIIAGAMLVMTVLALNVFGALMGRFAARRMLSMLLVMFAVSVITFLIFNVIPNGDPAVRMAGKQPTETQIEAIRQEWGFDEPVYEQYLVTMKKLFTGDMVSYFTQLDVVDEIIKGIPRTLSLAIGAAIIWMAFGVALGLYTAMRAGKVSDTLLTVLALIGISMPVFWIGALMNHYLGFELSNALGFELFPNGGYVEFSESPFEWAHHLILPWIALSILFIGVYSRVLRSNVLETMDEDFVRTARAKGLSERQVLLRHVLRNSLIPVVTLWGLDFAVVIGGGAILTETVFNLQGVGQYAADSIGQLDQPPILAITMFGAFFVVFFNAIVDIVYAYLDPRIRLGESSA